MDKKSAWILMIVMFCIASSVFAKDPDWYIKKDTWIETYLETINSICAGEKERGKAFVSNKNDGKLPVLVFCEYGWRLGEIPLEVDVAGVGKLYMGSSATGQFSEMTLVKEDGTEQRLVVDGKLTVDYVKVNERGRLHLREPLE